jgi:uncharacterized protein YxjI
MSLDGPTFRLHQKLVSLSGDAWIEDAAGNRVFEVDGKAFHVRRTVLIKDPEGRELFHIGKSLMHLHRTYEIQRGGKVMATVQGALVNVFGNHYTVKLDGGDELKVKGDIVDKEFKVHRGDSEVIHASHKLISIHDTYGVQVDRAFDPALAMAIVVTLDQMETEERNEKAAAAGAVVTSQSD